MLRTFSPQIDLLLVLTCLPLNLDFSIIYAIFRKNLSIGKKFSFSRVKPFFHCISGRLNLDFSIIYAICRKNASICKKFSFSRVEPFFHGISGRRKFDQDWNNFEIRMRFLKREMLSPLKGDIPSFNPKKSLSYGIKKARVYFHISSKPLTILVFNSKINHFSYDTHYGN